MEAVQANSSRNGSIPDTDPPVLPIALPDSSTRLEQDAEWCVARIEDEWQEFRFHDYDRIYEVEGLYERIFYDVLRCASPQTIRAELERQLSEEGYSPERLRVLDLGAGNGIMGEQLKDLGADVVVGIDIIDEAAEAAERDRPEIYEDYHVLDMTDLDDGDRDLLGDHRFNALTCVAALGFGDIPPRAFSEAFNLVRPGGWVAFNIKKEFLEGVDRSGFSLLIEETLEGGALDVRSRRLYRHRDATSGDPIHYYAFVGVKRRDIPHPDEVDV